MVTGEPLPSLGEELLEEGAEQEERKKKWGEGEGRHVKYDSMAVVVDDGLWQFN